MRIKLLFIKMIWKLFRLFIKGLFYIFLFMVLLALMIIIFKGLKCLGMKEFANMNWWLNSKGFVIVTNFNIGDKLCININVFTSLKDCDV